MKNADEPAFPTLVQVSEHAWNTMNGLTKREYFAAMAMQGIVSSYHENNPDPKIVASFGLRCADELIKQLES